MSARQSIITRASAIGFLTDPDSDTDTVANTGERADWQRIVADAVVDVRLLAQRLDLDADALAARTADSGFALRVPSSFVALMQRGDPDDPLLLQVLNRRAETELMSGYVQDPLEEHTTTLPGLVRKYAGRVLLTVATSCPVHCRYCFRRHFPYEDNRLGPAARRAALDAIAADDTISEVILSGGEPLMMKDRALASLLEELESIPSLSLLRIHTRFPVVVPERLTATLVERLARSRLRTSLVLHANHPNEIGQSLESRLVPLVSSPVTLLNQSVLLAGINDDVATLEALSRRLFDVGVLPYYLHVLDPVAGAAHFDVDDARARALRDELVERLPGYLVPTLVREVPDRPAKTRL